MRAQRLEQDLLILLRHRLVERALPGRLGQKFGDRPFEVRLDLADALRLAAESLGRMQIGIVIELNERLERDAEPAAVIQDRMVVVGNPPGPRD